MLLLKKRQQSTIFLNYLKILYVSFEMIYILGPTDLYVCVCECLHTRVSGCCVPGDGGQEGMGHRRPLHLPFETVSPPNVRLAFPQLNGNQETTALLL